MKKSIALLALALLPLSSFWYSALDKGAATYMANKGFIVDNGTSYALYRLDDTITRKEVMKIIAKLDGGTIPETCSWKFTDVVNDWGCKYIEWALWKGYIAANKTFRPNDNITIPEALKMILKARGIVSTYKETDWQANYIKTALDKSLIDTLYTASSYNTNASRWFIFAVWSRTYTDFVVPPDDSNDLWLEDAELEAELKDIFDLIEWGAQ